MKSFREYLQEVELMESNPAVGDVFELEIAREEIVLESYVVDVVEDGIVIEADDTMMRILMHVGYLTENSNMFTAQDTTSPINGKKDALRRRKKDAREFNFETSADDDLTEQQGIQNEAKYQGREVPLGKKMAGDVKKSKVYVRGPKGNVVKVNFGDPNMTIKKSNPARRKSFRARHNCANPGPRWKARYWSCRSW
jgi:hypothetical protein